MSTRGEQLEEHDILKATLMGYLQTIKKALNNRSHSGSLYSFIK